MSVIHSLSVFALLLPSSPARAEVHFPLPKYDPPADNAFDDYARAFALLPRNRQWDDLAADLDSLSADDAEVAIVEAEPVLEALREGIGKPCLVPAINQGFDTPFPYLRDFRSAARLLVVEGWAHARRGEFPEAFASYHDALILGQDAARGGAPIHKLVSIACEALACRAIRRTVEETSDQAALKGLVASLLTFEKSEVPLSDSLAVEYVAIRKTLEESKRDPKVLEPLTGDGKMQFPPAFVDDCLAALDPLYDRAVAAAGKDYWRLSPGDDLPKAGHPLLEPLAASHGPILEKVARHWATLRATTLVSALGLYFAQHKAYPERLDELVPATLAELPVDPFSGEGFRYRLFDPLNYLVYSVGPNKQDDGGVGDDVAFPTIEVPQP